VATEASTPRQPPRPASGPAPGDVWPVVLVGVVIGSACYVAAVTGLAHWPDVIRRRGAASPAEPLLVAVVAAVAAVAAAAGRSRRSKGTPGLEHWMTVALLLVGSGGAWVVWGVLDQHLLRTFDLTPGSAWAGAWDGLFHGVGVMAAGVGTSLISQRGWSADRPR
jgi:hypothetical protein